MNYSKALDKLVHGLKLTDVWTPTQPRAINTHSTPHGTARLDRLYFSPDLRNRKIGVETVMAAFKDHPAVCLRVTLKAPQLQQGRGRLKMNAEILEDTLFKNKLQQEWAKWKHQRKRYPNSVTWWGQYVKKKIQYIFMTEGKERA